MITSPLNRSYIFSVFRFSGYCCVTMVLGLKKYFPVTPIPTNKDLTPEKISVKYLKKLFIVF